MPIQRQTLNLMRIISFHPTLKKENVPEYRGAKEMRHEEVNDELFTLCEKLYFHEVDVRDKINARLQIPLAIGVAMVGVLSFMLQNVEHSASGSAVWFFYGAWAFAAIFIFLSASYFVKAAWGIEYQFIAPGSAWSEYRDKCVLTYKDVSDDAPLIRQAFMQTLCSEYGTKSKLNSEANDIRSYHLHFTLKFLINAGAYAFMAFMFFHFGNIDKNTTNKPLLIELTSPIYVENRYVKSEANGPAATATAANTIRSR